ncbi:hypothetical protein F5Y16DRAFT_21285 [Xylariaceae sp. FL0255]|nr:hypothetical protein F5Y16DRAFT_21285 [Xylariaceae sp. FL0255]
MASSSLTVSERLLDIALSTLSSPEPELQRGRKRHRRDLLDIRGVRNQIPSTESATFRGRCRHRSSSRFLDVSSLSRPTSQCRLPRASQRQSSVSPSSSRRKFLRILELKSARHGSQSPSRSGSSYSAYQNVAILHNVVAPKRRRQRTRSRSRSRTGLGTNLGVRDQQFLTRDINAANFDGYQDVGEQNHRVVGESREQR